MVRLVFISESEEPKKDGIAELIDKVNDWAISHGLDKGNPNLGMFVSTLIKYNNFERLCNVADSVHIIGNIYTNPELAEVE